MEFFLHQMKKLPSPTTDFGNLWASSWLSSRKLVGSASSPSYFLPLSSSVSVWVDTLLWNSLSARRPKKEEMTKSELNEQIVNLKLTKSELNIYIVIENMYKLDHISLLFVDELYLIFII